MSENLVVLTSPERISVEKHSCFGAGSSMRHEPCDYLNINNIIDSILKHLRIIVESHNPRYCDCDEGTSMAASSLLPSGRLNPERLIVMGLLFCCCNDL